MDWIRIRIDPELLPGSGTRKIQSWIRFGKNHSGSTTLLTYYTFYFEESKESKIYMCVSGSV